MNILKSLKDKVTIAQGNYMYNIWNGTMFVDLDWPLNASSLLSASAELLVFAVLLYAAETWTVNKENGKKTTCIWDAVLQTYFGIEMARSNN